MAVITGYASLQAAVADTLARSDLTDFIPNYIQNWEERFYRQPRNFGRWMEAELDETIASNVIAVPSDYLGLKIAYLDGQRLPPLDRVSLKNLYGRYPRGVGCTDLPGFISRDRTNFVFGPEPDSAYTVKGTYWAKPTIMRSFASDADAHWIIVNAPDLALYGALLESTPALRNDARIGVWQSFYDRSLQDYRDLHQDEDVSGGTLQEVLA